MRRSPMSAKKSSRRSSFCPNTSGDTSASTNEVFDWVVRALRESCSDEKREHSDAITRIQAEWDPRLQKRIDAMYVDKLDGRIDEGFYKRMRAQWRDEQERCERDIERHPGGR